MVLKADPAADFANFPRPGLQPVKLPAAAWMDFSRGLAAALEELEAAHADRAQPHRPPTGRVEKRG